MLFSFATPAPSGLLERVTAPASEPVTLAEAKLYLRLDGTVEDSLVGEQITTARMLAEQWLRRSLITQAWKLSYDYGVSECVRLPMGPVTAITGINMVQQDGGMISVNTNAYWLNATKNAVMLSGPIYAFRVEIMYSAGFGGASAVPAPIKQGILAHVAHLYENRGDMALPAQVAQLYLPYRDMRL